QQQQQQQEPDGTTEKTPVCKTSKVGPSLICPNCSSRFSTDSQLKKHQCAQSSKRANSCLECRKLLGNPQALRHHRRLQHADRPYGCALCDKTYRDASGLSRHRRVHMGYRPHSCNQCGKRFRDRSEVKRHEITHDKEKQEAKNQKSASRRRGLVGRNATSRTRASSGKVSCPHCPLSFNTEASLCNHLKVHFPEQKTYCCPICDLCFEMKEDLLNHWNSSKDKDLQHSPQNLPTGPPKCWVVLGYWVGFFPNPPWSGRTKSNQEMNPQGSVAPDPDPAEERPNGKRRVGKGRKAKDK
ncbi:zinc finger protein 57 homolog, partial [Perognathus longimembris pacificus]|uniref:zinc finger protein 57 homolog n=1 Tax=Perognathus longimembris pacificus TaxID=214514 RepID=UPI00201A0202